MKQSFMSCPYLPCSYPNVFLKRLKEGAVRTWFGNEFNKLMEKILHTLSLADYILKIFIRVNYTKLKCIQLSINLAAIMNHQTFSRRMFVCHWRQLCDGHGC